jgi:hypothetical protein
LTIRIFRRGKNLQKGLKREGFWNRYLEKGLENEGIERCGWRFEKDEAESIVQWGIA